MIEQGIVQLVQSNATVQAIAPVGGFFVQLPKDQALPSWSYFKLESPPYVTNTSAKGFNSCLIQIDCYAEDPASVIKLAAAVDDLLNGFSGTLPDPDRTFISSCFTADGMDFFNDAARIYRRMIEYQFNYSPAQDAQ